MPYRIQYRPSKERPDAPWAIIRVEDGTIAGRSKTKRDAEASARARMIGEHTRKDLIDESQPDPGKVSTG